MAAKNLTGASLVVCLRSFIDIPLLCEIQLLPIERAAKKQKKLEEAMEQESDEEREESGSEGEDEDDTVQANIDEMDRFKLPGAEEREKEGQCWICINLYLYYSSVPPSVINFTSELFL